MFVPKENINLVNAYIIFPLALFTSPPPPPTSTGIFEYLKHNKFQAPYKLSRAQRLPIYVEHYQKKIINIIIYNITM